MLPMQHDLTNRVWRSRHAQALLGTFVSKSAGLAGATWSLNQAAALITSAGALGPLWGFPKIRGPIFGSPYNKSTTFLGYYGP